MSDRKLRLFELLLVLSISFGGSLLVSFYAVTTGANIDSDSPLGGPVRPLYGILGQITSLALLMYVLHRRGGGLRDLGLSFSWKDLDQSFWL